MWENLHTPIFPSETFESSWKRWRTPEINESWTFISWWKFSHQSQFIPLIPFWRLRTGTASQLWANFGISWGSNRVKFCRVKWDKLRIRIANLLSTSRILQCAWNGTGQFGTLGPNGSFHGTLFWGSERVPYRQLSHRWVSTWPRISRRL